MMKFIIYIQLLLFTSGIVVANDAQLTASLNRTKVGAGESVFITFSINTNGSDFKAPAFPPELRIISGPNQSTSMQWINGNMSQSISYSFGLLAQKEGKYTIKPATIKVNGKTIQSNEVILEVVKGASQQQQAQQQNTYQHQYGQPQQEQASQEDISKNLFVRVSVDKSKAYVGEQIVVNFKLYQRVNLVNLGFNKLPSLNGFWSEVIDDHAGGNVQFHSEVLDGVAYNVAEIRKLVLFPQRAGKLEIDALSLDCVVRSRGNRRSQSIFDQFFGTYEDAKYTVSSKPMKIEVLALPEKNKPSDFNGAVGKFSIESRIDKEKVKAHEALNITLSISGKGNIHLMETPKPSFPEDMEFYDPKITDKTSISAAGASGTRSFEYLIIPRHAGKFSIEPFSFSYFDPSTGTYQKLTTGAFDIEVEKSDREDITVMTGRQKEDIKVIGSDIRHIQTVLPIFSVSGDFFFGSGWFYTLLTMPFLLFIGFLIYWKKQQEIMGNSILVRSMKANKMAEKRLANAKKYMEGNKKKEFYEEIFRALYGYVSDKLNIPVADLNKENISENLNNRNASQDLINKLNNTLSLCEMARFAPVGEVAEKTIYDDAVAIISKIEEELK
jgi:hypothetical protein